MKVLWFNISFLWGGLLGEYYLFTLYCFTLPSLLILTWNSDKSDNQHQRSGSQSRRENYNHQPPWPVGGVDMKCSRIVQTNLHSIISKLSTAVTSSPCVEWCEVLHKPIPVVLTDISPWVQTPSYDEGVRVWVRNATWVTLITIIIKPILVLFYITSGDIPDWS